MKGQRHGFVRRSVQRDPNPPSGWLLALFLCILCALLIWQLPTITTTLDAWWTPSIFSQFDPPSPPLLPRTPTGTPSPR